MQQCFNLYKTAIICCSVVILLGCGGFKLRGSYTFPDYLKTVYISPNDPYETFQRELRYRLIKNDVKIVSTPTPEVTVIEVSRPEIQENILAYNASGQGQRYNLAYSIRYKVLAKDPQNSRPQHTITRTRELTRTNDQLLMSKNEEQLVQKELMTETVTELLRQLTTRPLDNGSLLDSSTSDGNPC